MKKANKKRLAAIIGLVSILSNKPANALSKLAKGGVALGSVISVIGGGFLIDYLVSNKKQKGDGEGNKESLKWDGKKSPKINRKGQYYDENIRMLKEKIGECAGIINILTSFIDDTSYGFLNVILDLIVENVRYVNKQKNTGKWYDAWQELDDKAIAACGVAKGNSWVEQFFDDLRGNKKIESIYFNSSGYQCHIEIGGSRFCLAFDLDVDDGSSFAITRNCETKVRFQIEVNK